MEVTLPAAAQEAPADIVAVATAEAAAHLAEAGAPAGAAEDNALPFH